MAFLLILSCTFFFCENVMAKEVYINPHEMKVDRDALFSESKGNLRNNLHPHTMYVDPKSIYSSDELSRAKREHPDWTQNTESSCDEFNSLGISNIYIKRIINILLNSAYIEKQGEFAMYSGRLALHFKEEDYTFLKKFANSAEREDVGSLKMIDKILTEALQKSTYEKSADLLFSFGEQIHYMMFNKTTAMLGILLFLMYFVYTLIKGQFTTSYIIKTVAFLLYTMDFAVTYLHLIEAEEINNIIDIREAGNVPPECDPSKMTWNNYISYLFKSDNPCLKYYKATHTNLFYLVTPLKVLKYQLTVIFSLLKELGGSVGDFCGQLFVKLPWGLNIILWPCVLIFILFFLLITYSVVCDRTIKFNFLHLISWEFGGKNGNGSQGDRISGSNLQSLLFAHRKFIEDISEKPNITQPYAAVEAPKESNSEKKPKLSDKEKISLNRKSEKDENESGATSCINKTRTEINGLNRKVEEVEEQNVEMLSKNKTTDVLCKDDDSIADVQQIKGEGDSYNSITNMSS